MARKGYSKYKSKKVKMGDLTFDSIRERNRWCDLQLLEKAGEICKLERQVPFYLEGRDGPILTPTGRKMRYIADFTYVDWRRDGAKVVEDSKGFKTPEYLIKKAVLAAQGIYIQEV